MQAEANKVKRASVAEVSGAIVIGWSYETAAEGDRFLVRLDL